MWNTVECLASLKSTTTIKLNKKTQRAYMMTTFRMKMSTSRFHYYETLVRLLENIFFFIVIRKLLLHIFCEIMAI